MDRFEETASLIVSLNKYRENQIKDYDLILKVCSYFDMIKNEELSENDKKFLKFISNTIGIPHYYDLLNRFNIETEIENFDLNTLSAIIYESTLDIDQNTKVHKYQKQILGLFSKGKLNRYFLSASTSFGKTHIVFEIIKKMEYNNVVLIFPTIALLTENLERLTSSQNYNFFAKNYGIHTLSDIGQLRNKNIFIFTPERFLSFTERRPDFKFDFVFIDEVYKIDNEYIIDEEVREDDRDVAYRLAVFESLKQNVDALLAGPYIDFSKQTDPNYNASFDLFLRDYQIILLNYNEYDIVNKIYLDIWAGREHTKDQELTLRFDTSNKEERLIKTVKAIVDINQNTIVYCFSPSSVESYAKKIIDSAILSDHSAEPYNDFILHITQKFNSDWILIDALRNGIGIHHGLIPKYLQKEIVSLFNRNYLKVLISTTTITEGVNTSAKNLIILHSKKGMKELKKFDAKNIAGRAGRFMQHYCGRVITLDRNFKSAIETESEGIKHKNYDLEATKDEIDLFNTKNEFLKLSDIQRVQSIKAMQVERNIPDFIFSLFKVVSHKDKIEIFDQISNLTVDEIQLIRSLIIMINSRLRIDKDGFQVVLKVIEPIIENENLKFLINQRDRRGNYSILTHLVQNYLQEGFMGSVRFKMSHKSMKINQAIRETSKFVYNTLKYQVVKYLGVFNVMYKLDQSLKYGTPFEEVSGIEKLLAKLEYNALSTYGKIASDYGVPSSIVEYYENIENANTENANRIRSSFDPYEIIIFDKVEKIISHNNESV